MKNSNKIYIVIIVILTLMLAGLITYIVINDKFTAKPNLESSQISTKKSDSLFVKLPTRSGKFIPGYIDQNVTNFYLDDLLENDNLDLNQNFQNVKLNKYGIDYNVSCTEYDPNYPYNVKYDCINAKITIGKLEYEVQPDPVVNSSGIYIYLLNNYFIELYQSPESICGTIKVYKNDELVYENEHLISYEKDLEIFISNIFDYDRLPIEISNNRVFFFDDYSDQKEAYTYLKSINLDSNPIKEETYIKIPTDLGAGNCYENGVSFD